LYFGSGAIVLQFVPKAYRCIPEDSPDASQRLQESHAWALGTLLHRFSRTPPEINIPFLRELIDGL
jgi:hypothetical protein